MTVLKRVVAVVFLLAPLYQSFGQGQNIVFHVTSVRSEEAHDWCTTGECTATRITVEGYSDVKGDSFVTEYVLECIEVVSSKPSPHFSAQCGRVHAHGDYPAKLFPTAIVFGDGKEKQPEGTTLSAYDIKSEKEASKQKH